MILFNSLPCVDCTHCHGIVQPDGTERTEYVMCAVAPGNNAKNLLHGIKCDYLQQSDEEKERQ